MLHICTLGKSANNALYLWEPVFWIHDILVWIRFRIRGSKPLTNGPDPAPAIFVIDLQDANNKLIKKKVFLLITFWRYICIMFQRLKVQKKSQNSRNQGFSYYFCLLIEGSVSIPLANGSGSGRPINMWIHGSRSGFGSGSGRLMGTYLSLP